MSNKRLHLILGLVLTMFVGMIGSITSAISFNITLSERDANVRAGYMRRNMTPIHFKDNGNDFGGFIYFSNGIGVEGEDDFETGEIYIVQLGEDTTQRYECRQKVKGFYYNAERGEILWSLDGSYDMGVSTSGGLYTRCTKEGFAGAMKDCGDNKKTEALREECERKAREDYVDSHGYYGMIRHEYNGHGFVLAAGTNYDKVGSQRVMGNKLEATLIRFDNKYPVGFIYDGNGGVGFLGGELGDDYYLEDLMDDFEGFGERDLEKLFILSGNGIAGVEGLPVDTTKGGSATNSLLSVIVDGLVGINRDTRNTGIQGNQSNDKMQYFSSVNINNMQLINYAKQRAEILCRGKWNNFRESDSIWCISGGDGNIDAPINKTLIVKGRNVVVEDMADFEHDGNYDIFVSNGNLIIDEVTGDGLKVFKKNGFISTMELDQFSGEVMEILNDFNKLYTGDEVVAGKFIKGNFIIDGGVRATTASGFDHVYFVYGKMTTKDTVDDLGKVFKWRCKMGVQGTDGTPCPGTEKLANGTIEWTNPYENASLVIIDQNYPSPLYQ